MKFQLILSASALLLSTVPAALAGVTQYKEYAEDIQGQVGNIDGTVFDNFPFNDDLPPLFNDGNSGNGNIFDFDGSDSSPFNDMFVAIPNPNPFAGDSAAFRNGQRVGVRQAQNTWERLGGTCRAAWGSYSNAINIVIQRLQRARQSDRNDGRIAGLRQELQRRMRECNGRNPNPPRPNPNPRNPQVCIRFGEEAARRIAWDFCNPSPLLGSRQGSWRRDCRDVAINQCKGQVTTEVQNQCGLPRSTRTLRQLQDQCTDKVDSMIRSSSGRGSWNADEEMMLS